MVPVLFGRLIHEAWAHPTHTQTGENPSFWEICVATSSLFAPSSIRTCHLPHFGDDSHKLFDNSATSGSLDLHFEYVF